MNELSWKDSFTFCRRLEGETSKIKWTVRIGEQPIVEETIFEKNEENWESQDEEKLRIKVKLQLVGELQ